MSDISQKDRRVQVTAIVAVFAKYAKAMQAQIAAQVAMAEADNVSDETYTFLRSTLTLAIERADRMRDDLNAVALQYAGEL